MSRSIWANRDFMLLWAAQAISQTAQNAVNYGLLVLVQTRSHSSAQMSIAVLTVVVPSVVFGLLAGAYVDHRDKRLVLIGSNVLRAAAMAGYVLFTDYLPLIFLVNFVFSTISQFFAPAEAAIIPAIVARRHLIQANSLFHLTFTASQLGGLVLFGPIVVNLIGLDGLFVLVALSFVACAALLWPLPSSRRRVEAPIRGIGELWSEVRVVLGFVRTDRFLSGAVVYWTLGATLLVMMAALAPGLVVEILGIRAEDSVFILAPAGIGTLLGAALLSRWGPRFDARQLIRAGVLATGLLLVVLSSLPRLWAWLTELEVGPQTLSSGEGNLLVAGVMVTALLAGIAFVGIVVPAQTIIQAHAPEEIRGRVFAVQLVLSNVVTILPLLFLGGLADRIGVDWTLLLIGAGVVAFGLTSAGLLPSGPSAGNEAPASPESAA